MAEETLVFYVAPDGDALGRALAASRAAGTDSPRHIVLEGGSYFEVSLSLGPEDAGLTIEAAEGERPALYGGRKITGWQKEPEGDFWYAQVGDWDFRVLQVNGRLCERSRLPETGTFLHETAFDVPWLSTSDGGWARQPTVEELSALQYREGDLGPGFDARSAELTVYHKWDESSVGVASHDAGARTLRFTHPCGHPPGAFGCRKYVVWNTRAGMTAPGQWYLDRAAGRVYYWPLPGEDMAAAETIAPTVDSIVTFAEHAHDITIKGLRLAVTNAPLMAAGFGAYGMPGAVHAAQGLEKCRLEGLSVRHTGGYGIRIAGLCGAVAVEDCQVEHTGAGGILLHNAGPGLCRIESNLVRSVGRLCTSAIAVSAQGCDVFGNTIDDAPYTGIAFSGGSIGGRGRGARIEDNTVSRVMRLLNDGGAIYVTFTLNGAVRGNVIRDIQQGDEPDTGRNGIYLDEQTEGWVIEGNLVVDCTHPTLNHMSRGNVFRNNVFVSGSWLKVNVIRCTDYAFERNIVFAREKLIFAGNPDAIIGFSNNLLFSQSGQYEEFCIDEKYKHYDTRALNLRQGTVAADPRFADMARGDYSLRPGSPAFELGISDILK